MRDPLFTNRSARAAIVSMLCSADERDSVFASKVNAVISEKALTPLDPSTFGRVTNPVGNDSVSTTANSTQITCADSVWSASDVGKVIYIQGAGVSGGTHRTRILAYTNPTTVTVTEAPLTTVTASKTSAAGLAVWGNYVSSERSDAPVLYDGGVGDSISLSTLVSSAERSLSQRILETINVKDCGAVGDGVTDDTAAIQRAFDKAASMFNEVSFPPAGATYTSPTVLFPSGAYRITDSLNLYVGLTIKGAGGVAYTVEATRIIMDTVGGTVNLDKNILNVTRTFQSVLRSNFATVTIEDLGFWITNPGSTIPARGGTAFSVDGSGIGDAGTGCCIAFAEPTIDARVKRCNFYTVPNAAIQLSGTTGNCEIHECEFDTSTIGIRASGSALSLRVHACEFYGGSFQVYAANCTGGISLDGNELQFQSRVKVIGAAVLGEFHFVGNRCDGSGAAVGNCVDVIASRVNISCNTIGLCTNSAIRVQDAVGGCIASNTIVDAGYNATIANDATDPGAIKCVGCQGVGISGNSIVTPDAAVYGGHGIFLLDGTAPSRCVCSGNSISASYTGGAYRAQLRYANIADGDSLFSNVVPGTTKPEKRDIVNPLGIVSQSDSVLVSVTGAFNINCLVAPDNNIRVAVNAVSSLAQSIFDITVSLSPFDAVYHITNVSLNGVAAAGLGPHTISVGNTVTFSIVGSDLVVTSTLTTDALYIRYRADGVK